MCFIEVSSSKYISLMVCIVFLYKALRRHRFVSKNIVFPPHLCPSVPENKKSPTERYSICQGRIIIIRGATLIHSVLCACKDTCISPATDVCHTSQNTLYIIHLTAPSAVHLTTCFSPDSQHHRLSVKASLPLSPHQRFIYSLYYSISP